MNVRIKLMIRDRRSIHLGKGQNMKNYTLGLYEKAMPDTLSFKEKLKSARKAGFDFVELSIDETDAKLSRLDWTKDERLRLVKTMYGEGIHAGSMCLSGHRKYPLGRADEDTCKRGMEIMEKAIGLAEDLGIRIIQLAGYDVYYEESTPDTVKRFEENLEKAVHMASRAGVLLGFETMETEFMNTVEKAMRYVKKIDSSYLNVYPDCGNIKNAALTYGTDVYEDISCGKGHTVAMHLKETLPGIFREVPYGTGHVDFQKTIDTAWETGVRRFVTEFWYKGSPAWEADLKSAQNRMARILDKER